MLRSQIRLPRRRKVFVVRNSGKYLNTRNSVLLDRTKTAVTLELWIQLSDYQSQLNNSSSDQGLFLSVSSVVVSTTRANWIVDFVSYLASELFRMWDIHTAWGWLLAQCVPQYWHKWNSFYESLKDCTSHVQYTFLLFETPGKKHTPIRAHLLSISHPWMLKIKML